jgi:hypothetical protein
MNAALKNTAGFEPRPHAKAIPLNHATAAAMLHNPTQHELRSFVQIKKGNPDLTWSQPYDFLIYN